MKTPELARLRLLYAELGLPWLAPEKAALSPPVVVMLTWLRVGLVVLTWLTVGLSLMWLRALLNQSEEAVLARPGARASDEEPSISPSPST